MTDDAEKRYNVFEAFEMSILECPELWKHYERLFKQPNPCNLSKQPPINMMVDKATGYSDEVLNKAFEFFVEYIWSTMPFDRKIN